MLQLQSELTIRKNSISMARQAYKNRAKLQHAAGGFPEFPPGGHFNFAPASLYEITDPGDREVPKVSFT